MAQLGQDLKDSFPLGIQVGSSSLNADATITVENDGSIGNYPALIWRRGGAERWRADCQVANDLRFTGPGGLTILLSASGGLYCQGTITALGDVGSNLPRINKGWFTNLEITNMPTVGGTSINANGVLSLTSAEVTQLANIDSVVISNTNWGRLGALSNTPIVEGDSRLTDSRTCNNTFDNVATTRSNLGLGIGDSPTLTGLTLSGLSDGIVKSATGILSGGNTVTLTSEVSGILPVANGGTNSNTALTNDRVMVSSSGSIIESATITVTELGLLNGIVSVSTGTGDNDKFVTKGYVDDAIPSNLWNRVAGTPNYLLPATAADDIGATGARITKGWFTNLEITNYPTINGTAISDQTLRSSDEVEFTKIGIGTSALTDANFKIDTDNTAVDQQQTAVTNNWTATDYWQSFTVGITGYFTRLDWYRTATDGATTGTVYIYTGEGTGGTLLTTEAITISNTVEWKTVSFSNPQYLTASTQYTFRFVVSGSSNFGSSSGNPYAGGRSSPSSLFDMTFKTYMTTNLANYTVDNFGNVGIGTLTPTEKLSVIGNITTTGNITVQEINWINSTNLTNGYETFALTATSSDITIKSWTVPNGYKHYGVIIEIHSRSSTPDTGYLRYWVGVKRLLNNVATSNTATLDTAGGNAYGITVGIVGGATADNTVTISTTGAAANEYGKILVTFVEVA